MTPETIATGWILLAASLLVIGAFLAWGIRDWWSERQALKAEDTLSGRPSMLLCADRRPDAALPFRCMKHLGHPGDHVATTSHGQVLASWLNVDEMPPMVVVPQQRDRRGGAA